MKKLLSVVRGLAPTLGLFLAACGGDTSAPSANDQSPVTIAIQPAGPLTLVSGQSLQVTAWTASADGSLVGTATQAMWFSTDSTVVVFSGAGAGAGTIFARGVGTAKISVSSGTWTASASVTVTAGPARTLVIRTEPTGASAGSPLAVQPVVEFHDQWGNVATGSDAFVIATIGSGGGTLGGTTSVLTIQGAGGFKNLSISGSTGPHTLVFTAGVLRTTSAEFSVTP